VTRPTASSHLSTFPRRLFDDPLKPEKALSQTQRQAANEWYDHTLYSRLNDKLTGAIALSAPRCRPLTTGDPKSRRHRWREPKCRVDTGKVIPDEIQRQHIAVIFQSFAECVCFPCTSANIDARNGPPMKRGPYRPSRPKGRI
jgi:hypothetical protein